MRVAVWKIGEWKPSKFTSGESKRIAFKGLEDNKTYYLNLDTTNPQPIKNWEPKLKEGNVFDVTLQSLNPKNILPHAPFTLVRSVGDEK